MRTDESTSFASTSEQSAALPKLLAVSMFLLIAACGIIFGLGIAAYAIPRIAGSAEADRNEASNCLEMAAAFTDYPLLYAGSDILGHELRGCRRETSPERFAKDGTLYHPAIDSFTFVYGQCEIHKGRTSCPIPVAILVYPDCDAGRDATESFGSLEVRGARAARRQDGSIEIRTNANRVELYAPGAGPEEQFANAIIVAEALEGVSANATQVRPGVPLDDLASAHTERVDC